MKLNNLKFTLIILLILLNISRALSQQDVFMNATKKTTEAVGEFTGMLNVNIPIGTITSGSISAPVGISYLSNGLKPNEASSIIGNGWLLNEIATIYKTSMNMEDTYRELGSFFLCEEPICSPQNIASNTIDGAYDIYTFNILGYNGKFIHLHVPNQCVTLNKSEVKIERINLQNFKAILPNGVIVFMSRAWGSCFDNDKQSQVWSCDNIFSNDYKDTIKLTYTQGAYRYQTLIDSISIKEGPYNTVTPSHKSDYVQFPAKTLMKIEGKSGSLDFTYGNRTNFSSYNCLLLADTKCSSIKYCDGNECIEYVLDSDDYENASGEKSQIRLKELKVKKWGVQNNDTLPSYKFEYYGPINPNNTQFAPSHSTTGIDAWGYYNGATNNPIHNMTPSYVSGGAANRNPDFTSTRIGALQKITYPSGGTKSFEYQQNTYNTNVNEITSLFSLKTCDVAISNCQGWLSTSTSTIWLDHQIIQSGSLNLEVHNYGGAGGGDLYFYIKNYLNQLLHTISLNTLSSDSYQIDLADIKDGAGNPILIPGNGYIFELVTYDGAGYAFCNYIYTGTSLPAGGLRVSKITESNGNVAQDIVIDYEYGQGTLYQTPRFYEYFAGKHIYFNRTTKDENIITDHHIGYHQVTVSTPGKGKIIKKFKATFAPQYENQGGINVRVVTDKLSEGVGSPLSEEVYNSNNSLIKKDSFQYETVIHQSFSLNNNYFLTIGGSHYGHLYKLKQYTHRSRKILNYYLGALTATTEYTYGHSHTIQPSLIKVITGTGHITETSTDYTTNFWQNTNIKNYFVSKNIIIPYTVEVYENSKPVQGVTDDFSYYTSIGTFVGAVSNHASNIVRLSKKFIGQYDGIANAYITKPEEFAYHEYNNDGFVKSDQKINWPIKNYNYDGRERLTSVSQNGFVSSTTYLGNSNLTQRSTNVDGTYTDYTYDGLLRIKTKTAQPSGIVTEYFYGYYTQASGLNSIKTKTTYPVVAGSAINIIENITYSDKLGRKFASIAIKGSPSQKDMITSYEYDNLGRLIKEYLPVETIYNDGTYIAPGSPSITAGQVWKFAETKYEASPLSRVIESIAPDWYATKYEYGLNSSGDAVAIQTGGTYSANALIKATVIDGNGNRSISFTDFKGRLICQRKASSSDVPADRRDTYTHYDNKNRVTKVIPPGATATTTPEMVFEYKYDNEDKLLEKKIPGKGWIKYLYNSKDLLAAQQDANHLAINRWTVYSYDANGRSLKSGYFDGTTPNVESPTFTNATTYTESIYGTTGIEIDKVTINKVKIIGTTNDFINKTYTYDTRGRVQSYTSNNHKNLTASDVTFITYDNADNALSTTSAVTALPDGANTIHNLVESSNYDHRGRLTDDHIAYEAYGTKTIGSYVYNYRGEMIQQRQGKHNASTYLQDIDYSYRANGMLDKVNQPLGTATTGDLWYMEYYYDNPVSGAGSTIRKNGEIANIKWQRRGSTAAIHGYSYSIYGELTNVDYSDYTSTYTLVSTLKFDESFGYLSNGSFNTLTRRNDAATLIDNLQYNYVPNNVRLNRVNDLISNTLGHNQNGQSSSGNIYTYDTNGNLKSDLYRGVSNINYNYLDLPTLIQKSDGSKLEMTYDASGNLLTRKTYTTGSVLSETRDFIVNYEFKNSVIDIVHHAQGYLQRIGSNNFKYRYVIQDHLGSTRIVYHDDSGNGTVEQSEIIDENHYYAYGMEYAGGINSTYYAYKFNGIERVEAFQSDFAFYRGLDPILGRWYQVDPKAEAVMGMSPYCAMGNNPISYSDPDGDLPFLALIGIGAATGVFSNGLSNVSNGQNFFQGAGKAAFWGAVSAGASFGVGEVFKATGSFGHELLRAGAHAATQGGISAAQGGNFWQGALSGGIGSGISSGIDALGGTAGHQILGGGLGGGIGSAISGGNFWQGFGQGIAVGAFNHAAKHSYAAYITDKQLKNIYENYPKGDNSDPNYVSRDELFKKIGGPLYDWYNEDPNNPNLSNTCALRLSYALNKSGYLIPKGSSTFSGAGGLNYYITASNMHINLGNFFGVGKALGSKMTLRNAIYSQTGFSGGVTGHVDVMYRGRAGTSFYKGVQTTYWH